MKTLFSWLFTLTIFLSLCLVEVSCKCSVSVQSSLLKLNVDLNYPSWNASSDCCFWEGVSCDKDGHVTHLDLSERWINDTLNNPNSGFHLNLTMFLQNFPRLEELYFRDIDLSASRKDWCRALSSSVPKLNVLSLVSCRLSGPFDHSILRLQSLSIIDLGFNDLNCPLPEFFANFSNLISLDLGSSGLQGTVPREIFQIPTLQSIDLSHNEFLQGSLPEFLINNSLQIIDLSHTKFSGKLPSSIGDLWKLSRLDLSNCQFDGPLPRSIENLTRLKGLSLSHNNFTGPIPSFSFSKNLSSVDLSENSLNREIASLHFEGLKMLEYLSFSSNSLSGSVPSSLFALPSLVSLDLSHNQFSSYEVPNSSILYSLNLSHNMFNGAIQLNIFQGFSRLEYLDLSYNSWSVDVSDHSLEFFPQVSNLHLASCNLGAFPHFKNQSNLYALDLSNNQLSGEIPNWVWGFGNGTLTFLNLSSNNLVSIQEPYSFPNSLIAIDLHSNSLRGKISLSRFPTYADFSSNNFSSVQFDNVLNNFPLFYSFLSLSNNTLTGDIPESICHSDDLVADTVLDLSNNKLSGKIPTCIIETSNSLDVLNLRKNNLRGPIPDAFQRDCSLEVIDLNGNLLDGDIPKSLANCSRLRVLDLGHNNMNGEFPCFLKNISTLQVLILRTNNLHGSIECPDSDVSWPMLQILDIAHNRFNGELQVKWLENLQLMKNDTLIGLIGSNVLGIMHSRPIKFSKASATFWEYYEYVVTTVTFKGQERELPKILTIYTFIDLSSNNFHGSIPEEFGQLRALHVLSLSNNTLSGEIPSSIGNLRALESLDLSMNSLTGTIPDSLGDLNFLQFLNLSFNELVGEVPKGSQIQTFPEDSFIGNGGLCGFPLKKNCPGHQEEEAPNPREEIHENSKIDWNFLSAEIGFIVGFGAVVAPIMFVKRWRILYFDRVDDIIILVFPSAVARKWFQSTNTY